MHSTTSPSPSSPSFDEPLSPLPASRRLTLPSPSATTAASSCSVLLSPYAAVCAACQGQARVPHRIEWMGAGCEHAGGIMLQVALKHANTSVTIRQRKLPRRMPHTVALSSESAASVAPPSLSAAAASAASEVTDPFIDASLSLALRQQQDPPLVQDELHPSQEGSQPEPQELGLHDHSIIFRSSAATCEQSSAPTATADRIWVLQDATPFIDALKQSWKRHKRLRASASAGSIATDWEQQQQQRQQVAAFFDQISLLMQQGQMPPWVRSVYGSWLATLHFLPRFHAPAAVGQPLEGSSTAGLSHFPLVIPGHVLTFLVVASPAHTAVVGGSSTAATHVATMRAAIMLLNQWRGVYTDGGGSSSSSSVNLAFYSLPFLEDISLLVEERLVAMRDAAASSAVTAAASPSSISSIIDHLTAANATAGSVLPILCRPHLVQDQAPLPKGVVLVGFDCSIPQTAPKQTDGIAASPAVAASASATHVSSPQPSAQHNLFRTASFMARELLDGLIREAYPVVAAAAGGKASSFVSSTSAAASARAPPPELQGEYLCSLSLEVLSKPMPATSGRKGFKLTGQSWLSALPRSLFGSAYLSQGYANPPRNDPLKVPVSLTANYPLGAALAYPLREQERATQILELLALVEEDAKECEALRGSEDPQDLHQLSLLPEVVNYACREMGRRMIDAQGEYSRDLGLSSRRADDLVRRVSQAAIKQPDAVFGARINGAGIVVVLCREEAVESVQRMCDELAPPTMKGASQLIQ